MDPWQSSPCTVLGHDTPVWTRSTAPGHCTPVPHSDPPSLSPRTVPPALGSAAASELSPEPGWDAAHWSWQGAPAPSSPLSLSPQPLHQPPAPSGTLLGLQNKRGGEEAEIVLLAQCSDDLAERAGGTGHRAGCGHGQEPPAPASPQLQHPCATFGAAVRRDLHKGSQGPRPRQGLAGL